jgi:hypothetical protein
MKIICRSRAISNLTAQNSQLIENHTRKTPYQGGPAVVRDKGGATPVPAREELVLKVAKEIVVKFIEVGRLTPTTFADTFNMVIDTVRQSLKE